MASNTFTKIASVTVGSGGASTIDFNSIPATYTDLCIKLSVRTDNTGAPAIYMKINGVTTNMSGKVLEGSGSAASSSSVTTPNIGTATTGSQTASTFSNLEVYIPNYAGSNNKSWSADSVTENNATAAYADLIAGLWSSTSAITDLSIYPSSNSWVQYSTATLYGIKNS